MTLPCPPCISKDSWLVTHRVCANCVLPEESNGTDEESDEFAPSADAARESNDSIPVLNSPNSSVIEPVSTPPPNILSSWTEPVVRLIIAFLFSLTSSPDLNWLPLQSNFFATSLIYKIRNYAWFVWRNFLAIKTRMKWCTFSTFTSDRPLIAIRSLLEACNTAVLKGAVYPDYSWKILVHFNSGCRSYHQWCEFRHLVTSLYPKHWSRGTADPLSICINVKKILRRWIRT